MSLESLILFDIPIQKPEGCWSPNVWKARFTLNYKGIPYKTEWVEYPDVEALCLRYGAPATSKKPDGRPHYTLPMIYDPNTQTAVVESAEIAKYLDRTYPNTPQVFPKGTEALQVAFIEATQPTVELPLFLIIIARTCKAFNPRSAEYVRRSREAIFGKKLEELGGDEEWKALEAGLGRVDAWLKENSAGNGLLLMGDRVCFADIQLAAYFVWAKIVCDVDPTDWKRIAGWNNGKWGKFAEYFDQYAAVDNA